MEFSTICRVCMQPISLEYIDLDTPFNEATYFDCFNYCTKLEAKASDNLPKTICLSCSNLMQIAFDFIAAALEADRLLRECFDQLEGGEGENKFSIEDVDNDKVESVDLDEIIPKKLSVQNEIKVTIEDEQLQETPNAIHQYDNVKKKENTDPIENTEQNHFAKITDIRQPTELVLFKSTDLTEPLEYEDVDECSPIESQINSEDELQEDAVEFLTKNTETQKSVKPNKGNNERKQRAKIIDMEAHNELCKDECSDEDSVDGEFQISENLDNNSFVDANSFSEKSDIDDVRECPVCKEIVHENFSHHMDQHSGNRSYKCEQCDNLFLSPNDLKDHCSKKHKKFKDAWYCNLCGEAADSRADLTLHRNEDHRNQTPGLCITCGCSFSDQNALTDHVTKEHWSRKRPVECPYCIRKFQLKTLPMHVRYAHLDIVRDSVNKEFTCKYCLGHCEDKKMLEEHIKIHTVKPDYSCEICEETFQGKIVFQKHMEQMHPAPIDEKNIKTCPKCKFITSDEMLMLRHKKRHYNDEYYKLHMKRYTKTKTKYKKNISRSQQYLCSFCPRQFKDPKSLHKHEDFQHGNKETAFQCDLCDKKYLKKISLRCHKLSAHGAARPFLCKVCPKAFKLKAQLQQHVKIHSEKKIECPHCDKKFLLPCYLKIHLRTHTNELPYECHLCDKKFAIRVRLTYHLAKHEGTVFQCEHCPETFSNKPKLRVHRFEHIGYPFVCDYCQEKHHRRVGFSRHMRRVHGLIFTEADIDENRFRNMKKIYGRTNSDAEAEPDIEILS